MKKNILIKGMYVIGMLFLIWCMISIMEIIIHNKTDCIYSNWNIIVILSNYAAAKRSLGN